MTGGSTGGARPGGRSLTAPVPVPGERARDYVARGYWNDRLLRDGIEAAGTETPAGLALADLTSSLTWQELAARISAGVGLLRQAGVTPGGAVVVVSGNTIEGVVAYHSILRIGATAVLLDRRCGASDLRLAVESISVSHVVLPASEASRLAGEAGAASVGGLEAFTAGPPVPAAEEDGAQDEGIDSDRGWLEPDRDVPAVVLFTSGTTSRPKGVVHSINTLTAGARHMIETTRARPDSTVYLVSPMTSITGVMQMHLCADAHCTLVLDDAFDPNGSLERLNQYGDTILGGAPVIAERLIGAADTRPERMTTLRHVSVGGSMLPRAFLQRISSEYGIDVVRVYGSSEAPNTTGRYEGDPPDHDLADDGALMPGSEARVGSAEHTQEGMLRGPNLMLGYLDPSDNQAAYEEEWYRTGDLLDVTSGRVTVIGRIKEIANRNGHKISLPEVEAALLDFPGVAEYAAFPVPDSETGERLSVAVVPADDGDRAGDGSTAGDGDPSGAITLDDVICHLRDKGFAVRKLPEQLTIWDEPLPRTASGKVIRSRLTMDAPSKRSMFVERLR